MSPLPRSPLAHPPLRLIVVLISNLVFDEIRTPNPLPICSGVRASKPTPGDRKHGRTHLGGWGGAGESPDGAALPVWRFTHELGNSWRCGYRFA